MPSATRPADEAAAWTHFVALKPGNFNGLQRLALAQAQMATNLSNQAQTYQQQASASSPGNDSTFSGGTLGSLSQDPVSQAQAAADSDQQTQALLKASVLAKKANTWWKKSGRHLRQDRRAAGLQVERPRGHDLAQLRIRGAERERHEVRDQGLQRLPQARARRHQRAAGALDREAAEVDRASTSSTTTP